MIVAGSQGHAIEVYEILKLIGYQPHEIIFFDDINNIHDISIPAQCKLSQDVEEVKLLMEVSNDYSYVYGLGGIKSKQLIKKKFDKIGAHLKQVIAPTAILGTENVVLGKGVQCMHSTILTSKINIGNNSLINAGARIMHDVNIGENCEIGPAAVILGRTNIGNHSFIGAGATILPDVEIGDYVTIGAGAVVTKNIPSNYLAVGVPAKLMKQN